jgi:hypothetical protein
MGVSAAGRSLEPAKDRRWGAKCRKIHLLKRWSRGCLILSELFCQRRRFGDFHR